MGLLTMAVTALTGAERRTDIAARNIANAQTPGYKREVAFSQIADGGAGSGWAIPTTGSIRQAAEGVLTDTGNPLDLAVRGDAFMLVRDGDRFFLSRGGQLHRDGDGALSDSAGRVVQQAGGGDLTLELDDPEIVADGTVLSSGTPVGNIGIYAADAALADAARTGLSGDQALALNETDAAGLRQGMLERSNVVLSDEMIGMMRNQRLAEGGAQLVHAYDQLIGQAVATFGKKS